MSTFTDASLTAPTACSSGGALPGLGVAIAPGGGKSFFLQHTQQGTRHFYRIGAYPAIPLSAAREQARELLAMLERGIDPRAKPEPQPATGTLETLLGAWLEHQRGLNRRRLGKTEQLLRGNVPAALLEKPAAQIQPADIRALLATVHQRGARVMANRLRAHLHSLFAYGLRADHDPRPDE